MLIKLGKCNENLNENKKKALIHVFEGTDFSGQWRRCCYGDPACRKGVLHDASINPPKKVSC